MYIYDFNGYLLISSEHPQKEAGQSPVCHLAHIRSVASLLWPAAHIRATSVFNVKSSCGKGKHGYTATIP